MAIAKSLIVAAAICFASSEVKLSEEDEIRQTFISRAAPRSISHRKDNFETIQFTPPYRCKITRIPTARYNGTAVAVYQVKSEAICALLCFLFKGNSIAEWCIGSNFVASEERCELMRYQNSDPIQDPSSMFLVAWQCLPDQSAAEVPTEVPINATTTPEISTTKTVPPPEPMECTYFAKPRSSYQGILLKTETVDNEEECALRCWRFEQIDPQSRYCMRANYIESQQQCDLMGYKSVTSEKLDENSLQLSLFKCKPAAPVTAQPPSPFPGACGQTTVTLRNKAGIEAAKYSIPFIVSLTIRHQDLYEWHYCAGSLIRVAKKDESDIVVTSARCVVREKEQASRMVIAGVHYQDKKIGQRVEGLIKSIVHLNYNKSASNANDIAVVKLRRPIEFSKTIQPVCLPEKGAKVPEGARGVIAGWGTLNAQGDASAALIQTTTQVIGTEKCKQTYKILAEDAQFCAGYPQGGKGVCIGDSGSPYFVEKKTGYTLEGIVSAESGCGRSDSVTVMTRLANYVDWIQEQARVLTSVKD